MSTPSRARGGLGPLDEYPLHQVPQPIGWPGSSDRHFYDRCYFNAHDRTGDIFVISGMGYYPNLRTKDAFFLVTRGDQQTAIGPQEGPERFEPADVARGGTVFGGARRLCLGGTGHVLPVRDLRGPCN